MQSWAKENRKQAPIQISTEGITKALEAGKRDFERREFDRDCVIWLHVVSSILYTSDVPTPEQKKPIERLFEIVDTKTYRNAIKNARAKYHTDEVPTDFDRTIYRRFLEWQAKRTDNDRSRTVNRDRHYGVYDLETRWELGEIEVGPRVKKQYTGDPDEC